MEEKDPIHYTTGMSPLHLAAKYGHLEVCQIIIKKVKKKDRMDTSGKTPFFHATENGHLNVCKLLKSYANVKTTIRHGRTPLHVAAEHGHLDVYKYLFKILKKKTPIDEFGNTPLHVAAKSGHLNVCELIFELAKTDREKNPLNKKGRTPLHLAARHGHGQIVNFFLLKAPNDENGKNPIDYIKELTHEYPPQFFDECTEAEREHLLSFKKKLKKRYEEDREKEREKERLDTERFARTWQRWEQGRRLERESGLQSQRPAPTGSFLNRGQYNRP